MQKQVASYVKQYLLILLGSISFGIGTTCFIQAGHIAAGGVTGIFNVISHIHPIPVGLCVTIANIPLIILAFIKFKARFAVNTLIGLVLSSAAVDLLELYLGNVLPFTDDILLSALAGGFFNGLGIGLVMRNGASTGGTDIIMKLIHRKLRHLKGGVINVAIGITICGFYLLVTGNVEGTLYTALSIVVDNFVFDLVLYGGNDSKTVYIITNDSDRMAKEILETIESGATILNGTGAYTGTERKIILCVIRNSVFPALKETVKTIDPNAFMIVTKSSEVFGNGYENFNTEII